MKRIIKISFNKDVDGIDEVVNMLQSNFLITENDDTYETLRFIEINATDVHVSVLSRGIQLFYRGDKKRYCIDNKYIYDFTYKYGC